MRRTAAFIVMLAASIGLSGCDYVPESVKALFRGSKGGQEKFFEKGTFKGELEARFASLPTGDGVTLELIQLISPYGYRDSKGLDWDVPAGDISDGASIPWPLWSLVGGPYSGPYRNAAVIHDYYSVTQERTWQATHLMFYEAALKAGTPKFTAKLMYAAILADGPTWAPPPMQKKSLLDGVKIYRAQVTPAPGTAPGTPPANCEALITAVATKTDKEKFMELRSWIERTKPKLRDIQICVGKLRKARPVTR